ncbi:hypothetical protein G4V62_17300 [Bacillaceae bacterium SIJ1]|uniref:DUF294 nucleotidyltransferase-like domain-containing protein n=1 Tax=Litoribacterium kuwaitense TaxID=1398745 RepID=UPI0013EC33E0|nr:DUF294 nucleotidyltransferase-like domain-containing protein [Litoribacterium kuwaitense]NGP46614.1 hypothetical protein [Litoribacterium kuwaitense]
MVRTYEEIRHFRDESIAESGDQPERLSSLHDDVFIKTVEVALRRLSQKKGPPPTRFCWFVMGSAGRKEHALMTDQDHGFIYTNDNAKESFLRLGEEISAGLHSLGYPYCNGNVMSSNPQWCCSESQWSEAIEEWMNRASWETVRHLLIFLDGRSLYGDEMLLRRLKHFVYKRVQCEPRLLCRMEENGKIL